MEEGMEGMRILEYGSLEGDDTRNLCVRGGPIFVPNLVGSLTSVRDFQPSVLRMIDALKEELSVDSIAEFDDELSVEVLRVLSEEELVNKAFKEAFKDTVANGNSSQISQNKKLLTDDFPMPNNEMVCLEPVRNESNATESFESSNGMAIKVHEGCSLGDADQQHSRKKRKRAKTIGEDHHSAQFENGYMERVEKLAILKHKQDEDKAAARLHSFNGSDKIVESAPLVSENIERMSTLRFISSPMQAKSWTTSEHVPVRNPETVLSIEIYHNSKMSKKTQEFLVLGRQMLSELRDRIFCVTDQLMQKAGHHCPSGYFLIEDVFCNDTRDPNAIDYSKPIFEWLRNNKEEASEKWEYITVSAQKNKVLLGGASVATLPNFKTCEMHKVRFCDLQFRLGCGYLYCHQGDCRHVIVIRDMRLVHADDLQNRAAYPIMTFQLRPRWQKCSVCRTFRPTKVTVDDKWAGENPCYFCDSCFFLLHYSEDGMLLYNEFEVYDFHNEY